MAHHRRNISMGFSPRSHPETSFPICIKQAQALGILARSTTAWMFNNVIKYLASRGADRIDKSHFPPMSTGPGFSCQFNSMEPEWKNEI